MPTTPNFLLRYPTLADANDVPADLQRLASDTDAAIKRPYDAIRKAYSPYSVVWSGGSTLSIGNGTLSGHFLHHGYTVFYKIRLERGSTTNLGSGPYTFTLPMPAVHFREVSGSGYSTRGGNGGLPLTAMGVASGSIGLLGPAGRIDQDYPGSWAVGDIITVAGSYRVSTPSAV